MPYPTTMLIDNDPSEADHHTPVTVVADEDDPNSTGNEYVTEIRRTLLAAFTPVTYVGITDVTDGHTVEGYKDGRALAAHGHELLLLLVTPVFDQVALLQRQRMIHNVLHGDLQTGHLHSIRMKCFTPAQWRQKGQPPSFHPPPGAPCVMNMKNMAVLVRTTPTTEDTTTTTTTDEETTLSSSSCASSTTEEEAEDHEEDCDCFEEHDTDSDTSASSASSSSYIPPARMVARLRGHSHPSTSTMSSRSMCACGDYRL